MAAALLCALVCVGCSDDSSVDVTAQCLALLPDESAPSGRVISRTGEESTCNFLQVELVATDIDNIRSAEINFSYPFALTAPILAEVGPLLLGEDDTFVACDDPVLSDYDVFCKFTEFGEETEVDTRELDISLTSRTNWTVDAPPEGAVLARLTFQQLTTLSGANGPFAFNFGKLLDDGNEGQNTPTAIIDLSVDPSAFVGGQMVIQGQ
jgi:hypothetical protein